MWRKDCCLKSSFSFACTHVSIYTKNFYLLWIKKHLPSVCPQSVLLQKKIQVLHFRQFFLFLSLPCIKIFFRMFTKFRHSAVVMGIFIVVSSHCAIFRLYMGRYLAYYKKGSRFINLLRHEFFSPYATQFSFESQMCIIKIFRSIFMLPSCVLVPSS